jgi:hypothetical protein
MCTWRKKVDSFMFFEISIQPMQIDKKPHINNEVDSTSYLKKKIHSDSKDDQSGTRAEIYCVHTTQPTSGMTTHVWMKLTTGNSLGHNRK